MFLELRGLKSLKKKFAFGYEEFKSHTINAINQMVVDIANEARKDAADLPYSPTNAKVPYKRTGKLSRSIYSTPFNGKYAEVIVGASYGAYVEFGTGNGFGIPKRKYGITQKHIIPYALTFRGSGIRKYNMPYRSYLFSNFNIEYPKALKKIRAFKMK